MAAAASPATTASTAVPMTRREFLYYIWAASMALFTAELGGAILWFAVPRFAAGEFGGVFELDISQVPPPDSGPASFDAGRFWLVNVGEGNIQRQYTEYPQTQEPYPQSPGVKALYKVCVHLGCLYKWVPTNDRFECPCHGSKYLPTGVRVEGPATRNLDIFVIQAVDANGNVLSEATDAGQSVDITGAARLRINTGRRLTGAPNTRPGGGV